MSASIPVAIVIASGVVYHLAQKGFGASHPWSMLSVAYGAAFALASGLAFATRATPGSWRGTGDGVIGLLVGLSAFGVEAGYFFLYRSGWPLSSASVVISLSVTAALAVLGVFAFGEHLSVARIVGLVLAVCGVVLIARG